ncbi:MAG: hypothetical protein A3G18_10840 [Rhodospirillales bacterium RIFCSPLOWO2_12_FULL_58_28]|nr:MAG: hypothetical protein A3H92_11195 [Rhodospirillales bacterium RIFCSPLOWO2_02_FULL_58_16]OHC77916.1 MAG: hypothetical protein A3G18_10840 [Rhodospirillales bacterium RIFCSPLOWO2_12_FULL_58_28]
MNTFVAHALYALAWVSFGFVHSLLADDRAKRRLTPTFGAYYRLGYNLFAAVHIALVFAVGAYLFADGKAFLLAPWAQFTLTTIYVLGWAAFLWALKGYDLGRLAGTATGSENEPLLTDGLHRYVRHPLYAGALLIIWGRVDDEFGLATAAWASLYLAVGACFEERRLLKTYGADYADYRRKVPAFIPWKWRAL